MTLQTKQAETVLILGNYRPCLAMARALSASGYRVAVSSGLQGEFCERSRCVEECWDHPPLEQEEDFFSALSAHLAARPDITTVFPIWEPAFAGFHRFRHLLPDDRTYVLTDASMIALCMDKARMLKVSTEAGMPHAPWRIVRDYRALQSAGEYLGFPLVVRPGSAHHRLGDRKAVIAGSREELVTAISRWPDGHDELIAQRLVKGHRINIYFAARKGQAIRYLAARISKTDIDDGTGLAVDGMTIPLDPGLRQMADRLVDHLSYHGIGCMQFMRDERTGEYSFLELNPRIAGNHAIAEACGLELSRLAIALARGEADEEELYIGPAGRRYVWTYGRFSALRKAFTSRQIGPGQLLKGVGEALKAAMLADVHITWRWSDPLPTLLVFARQLPAITAVALRPLSRRLGNLRPGLRAGSPVEPR